MSEIGEEGFRIIAGTYEIQKQIGAGGGGIVYLGHHLRLKKQVVLKADRRALDTKPESLRREVDMLKGLSHTYIPQVYDFVQENGIVYTVMDYIEGESLDKLLKRNQLPTQPQVISWACQLLEALVYLHGCPPHGILHGDIKPANIMLRPSGDISLIDYNIALALGENGAVKVGFSRGYASPEHYSADFISKEQETEKEETEKLFEEEETLKLQTEEERTLLLLRKPEIGSDFRSMGSSVGSRPGVLLDVRSDIYSLGATLYHLLTGERPAQEAEKVSRIGVEKCSPEIAEIIQKAMSPRPEERYQTAEEMLEAFLSLHKCDRRMILHKKRQTVSMIAIFLGFLLGGISSFTGMKQLEQLQTALTKAEYSDNALAQGDIQRAIQMALQGLPKQEWLRKTPEAARIQTALTSALGVYELADGFQAFGQIHLSEKPWKVVLSPEGSYLAAMYAYELAIFDTENMEEQICLSIEPSALSDVVFIDETHFLYAGSEGITAYDLDKKEVKWTGEKATTLAVSENGKIVAAVERDSDYAVLYNIDDGTERCKCFFDGQKMKVATNDIFADPKDRIFTLSADGSLLAVSFSKGRLSLFDVKEQKESMLIYEGTADSHFYGGFHEKYFTFVTNENNKTVFEVIDTEKREVVGAYDSKLPLLVQSNSSGIFLAEADLLVRVSSEDMSEKELAYTQGKNITGFSADREHVLLTTEDNRFLFFDKGANLMSETECNEAYDFIELKNRNAVLGSCNKPFLRLLKIENHKENQLISYDAGYPHDEARISNDGKTVMLFSYQGFQIYDITGKLITEENLPEAESIYDQQFVKEKNSRLEVTWYDGTIRNYSAANGELLSEEKGMPPEKNLYEEFYTDDYKIESSLHEAPQVYYKATGKYMKDLEERGYLTYVTELEDYIITEYVSTEGEKYGLLLDKQLNTLAHLPGLCDVMEDSVMFDYQSGDLRQCRLYSLQELIALGEAMQ